MMETTNGEVTVLVSQKKWEKEKGSKQGLERNWKAELVLIISKLRETEVFDISVK